MYFIVCKQDPYSRISLNTLFSYKYFNIIQNYQDYYNYNYIIITILV